MNPRPRIIVADDEAAIMAVVAEALGYAGFEVRTARGGAEAIRLARAERPDLVLLDVMMPDLDGRDACRAIKMDRELQPIKVVLFSSADERDIPWRAAGADAFLQKPFSVGALIALLRGLVDSGRDGG